MEEHRYKISKIFAFFWDVPFRNIEFKIKLIEKNWPLTKCFSIFEIPEVLPFPENLSSLKKSWTIIINKNKNSEWRKWKSPQLLDKMRIKKINSLTGDGKNSKKRNFFYTCSEYKVNFPRMSLCTRKKKGLMQVLDG